MKLVIAEKKDVALLIARAVCGVDNPTKIPVSGNGYTVTAAQGHLLSLVPPEAYDARLAQVGGEWSLEDLPIQFDNWKREVKREADDRGRPTRKVNEFAQKRVESIRDLAADCDCVINAGDPDDEGQCLIDEIIEYIGWTGPVERVYINDSIEKNVAREFTRLKDNEECRGDGLAAYARSMADFVFGLNESRLVNRRLGVTNVSVGRVQTPTLALIVARDLAIEKFFERDYYEALITLENSSWGQAVAKFEPSKEFLDEHAADGKHILDRAIVEAAVAAIVNQGALNLAVERKNEKKSPPLPYNITQLEGEMNRRYGYTSSETLSITQTLRDKHRAITYNRTSSSYLKEEHYQEAPQVLKLATANVGLQWPLDYSIHSKAFNDAKVTAHHGIIPQESEVDVSAMSQQERNVYIAIVERYALQFLPPAVYDTCKGAADAENGRVAYKARKLVDAGWMKYVKAAGDDGDDSTSDKLLPAGEHACRAVGFDIAERKTTPPKRYTEETLLADMTNAAKFVKNPELKAVMKKKDEASPNENGSIGTPATRHTIIEILKRRGFIEVQGKKNLVSTPRGRAFISILPEDIKSIDTTARWFLIQEEIRAGAADVNKLPHAVADNFRHHKETAYEGITVPPELDAKQVRKTVGKCPRCGKDVIEAKNSFQCMSNKFEKQEDGTWVQVTGCAWSFGKTIAHKKITSAQGIKLLEGKKVKITGMTSAKGNKFDAYVKVTDLGSGKLEFSFEGVNSDKGTSHSRPGRKGGKGRKGMFG